MIVRIRVLDMTNGNEGILQYDDDLNQRAVVWGLFEGDDQLKEKLKKYFLTERDYRIPESQDLDDYRIETAKPILKIDYFQLSLSTLYIETGIKLIEVINLKE